jgi:hypothetical protein
MGGAEEGPYGAGRVEGRYQDLGRPLCSGKSRRAGSPTFFCSAVVRCAGESVGEDAEPILGARGQGWDLEPEGAHRPGV